MVSPPAPTSVASSPVALRLEPDQLELELLVRQFLARVVVVDRTAREPLAGLDDLVHLLLDGGEVVRGERARRAGSRSRSRPRSAGRCRAGCRGTGPARPAPCTCAAECRSTASPSGEDAGTASTSVSCSGAHARSRSTPSGSRTTTAPCGPFSSTPASRSASTAVVPAATRMGRAGVDGTALADTRSPSAGRSGRIGRS